MPFAVVNPAEDRRHGNNKQQLSHYYYGDVGIGKRARASITYTVGRAIIGAADLSRRRRASSERSVRGAVRKTFVVRSAACSKTIVRARPQCRRLRPNERVSRYMRSCFIRVTRTVTKEKPVGSRPSFYT